MLTACNGLREDKIQCIVIAKNGFWHKTCKFRISVLSNLSVCWWALPIFVLCSLLHVGAVSKCCASVFYFVTLKSCFTPEKNSKLKEKETKLFLTLPLYLSRKFWAQFSFAGCFKIITEIFALIIEGIWKYRKYCIPAADCL